MSIDSGTSSKTASGPKNAGPDTLPAESGANASKRLWSTAAERPTLTIALPAGWARSALAGVEAALLGWAVPALAFAVAFLSVSSNPWVQDISVGAAARTGAEFWVSSFGVPIVIGGIPVSLTPLLWTVFQVVFFRALLLPGRAFGSAALWTAAPFYLATCLIIVAASGAGVPAWTVLPGALVVALTAIIWAVVRQSDSFPRWVKRLRWVWSGLSIGLWWLAAVALVGALALLTSVVASWDRIQEATIAVPAGMIGHGALWVLQAMYIPVFMAWGLAWLAGPGFTFVGAELISPTHATSEVTPFVPWVEALPTTAPGLWVLWILVAVGLALGIMGALRTRRLTLVDVARRQGVALALFALLLAAWMSVAHGSLGADLLANLGPTGLAWLAVSALVGGVGATITLVFNRQTMSLVKDGAQAVKSRLGAKQAGAEASNPADGGGDDGGESPQPGES